ncbi:DUF2092 domain-containing protein [Kitasatospora sp. NPDC097643]|uniref:LolA family protein n=1 Tax=Kitasatospora sp. NPDC097643 TaxID=3157230 RepID=UPI003322F91D
MTNDTVTGGGVDDPDGGVPYRSRRRTLVRVAVPLAVVAVIATGVGLVPALAADSPPDLPALTAEQVVAKALGSEAQTLSGTVSFSTDLGLPGQLLGAAGGFGAAVGGGGGGKARESAADPQGKLLGLLGGDQTLRVAVDGPDHQRLDLLENMSGYTIVHNGDQAWAWDSSTNSAEHLTGGAAQRDAGHDGRHGGRHPGAPLTGVPTTPQDAARQFLTASAGTTSVTVAGTTKVAGKAAYQLSVKPAQPGSTIGDVRIAVAADNGVPLAVVVKASDGSTVLDVHFTDVSFAKPAAKTFEFTVPKGAKVTERKAAEAAEGGVFEDGPLTGFGPADKAPGEKAPGGEGFGAERLGADDGFNVIGEGWTTVFSAKLPSGPVEVPQDGGQGGKGAKGGRHGDQKLGLNPQGLVKSFGKPVGGGTLVSTKVFNVLLTDDGRIFAGAVTPSVLQHAAGVN